MNCHKCAGYGLAKDEDGDYEMCQHCKATGLEPRDPWTRPVLIAAAIIALYFVWQFMR